MVILEKGCCRRIIFPHGGDNWIEIDFSAFRHQRCGQFSLPLARTQNFPLSFKKQANHVLIDDIAISTCTSIHLLGKRTWRVELKTHARDDVADVEIVDFSLSILPAEAPWTLEAERPPLQYLSRPTCLRVQ